MYHSPGKDAKYASWQSPKLTNSRMARQLLAYAERRNVPEKQRCALVPRDHVADDRNAQVHVTT
jgi:hypothetical protein